MKFFFYFILIALFSRYLNFRPHFFGEIGKGLDKKAKVNFKIYGVIDWETNNYNTDYRTSKQN